MAISVMDGSVSVSIFTAVFIGVVQIFIPLIGVMVPLVGDSHAGDGVLVCFYQAVIWVVCVFGQRLG
ncbi:hypothetical protein [Blautia hydrogenotrophica]|uniref:Uncharacterized protein n=2 Tax=Blautia hydrogenotrophica TaxID=53443 RepID=C0CQP5_BLAHS|nr:hypothetical protein [Blautia hydrogenotrophica]EEG47923.1 hypothetical protein RUMHYD_03207 [Blautia hydrogenotrophica DSM 10507]MCT6797142.1 hypothetical protein [Blautia hydrogenotrophica]MEE0464030.1 hypothetical protein [Blautia hydrogenotrophica]SCH74943.1 Uncharacterised protein [uncultured Blautia sp.]